LNNALTIALAVIGVLLAFFLMPLIGIAVGAFIGWVVGLVFPGTIGIIGTLLTSGATMPAWQVGAILGFVGGFFKTRVTSTNNS
jgi:hypothetical protein